LVAEARPFDGGIFSVLEHDPEKWMPVFPRDKREAFARRSCSNKKIERDDDSNKSHPALGALLRGQRMLELWNNWYETLVSVEALATVVVIVVVAAGVITLAETGRR
jgi:hypothetical protein